MLSETSKSLLSFAIPKQIELFGLEHVQADGPKTLVDWLMEPLEEERDSEFNRRTMANIRDNRKEAEQYLAGLLGMM